MMRLTDDQLWERFLVNVELVMGDSEATVLIFPPNMLEQLREREDAKTNAGSSGDEPIAAEWRFSPTGNCPDCERIQRLPDHHLWVDE